jgi:hypothetical protein
MNFKRGRPKNRRAGCLMCKPHKANGCKSKGHRREEAKARRQYGEDTEHVLRGLQ